MPVAYISPNCPSCKRFRDTLRTIPSLQSSTRIVDIHQNPTPGIQFVPTVVTDQGEVLVGKKVFEFLAKFQGEAIAFEPMDINTAGRLPYGSISDGGTLSYTSLQYDF